MKTASQRNPPENRLKCPTCGLIFIPDQDPETHPVKCPRCATLLPAPKSGQKSSFSFAESKPQQETPLDSGDGIKACTFFFACAVIVFLIGQITAFVEDARPVVTIDLGVSAIVFLLAAIYFKLPKPK